MIGLLKDFETAVIDHWHTNRDLSDHAVTRVYEAAAQVYDAELRGRRPRPHGLTGSELDLFENVRSVAEYRLGRGPGPVGRRRTSCRSRWRESTGRFASW
jgi:hypothetical protein